MARTKTAERIEYLRAEVRRLSRLLHKTHWTPQDVEKETLRGYDEPWLTAYDELVERKAALKQSRASDAARWGRNPRLDAWNKAVTLGGEHYDAWRTANIEPMQQRVGCHTLWRGQITKLIKYEQKLAQWRLTQAPSSDTPACAQSPQNGSVPRSK
jgi:hypothetical protein